MHHVLYEGNAINILLDERYACFSFCVSDFISPATLYLCDLHYIYEWFCEKKQCVTMKTGKCQLKKIPRVKDL